MKMLIKEWFKANGAKKYELMPRWASGRKLINATIDAVALLLLVASTIYLVR